MKRKLAAGAMLLFLLLGISLVLYPTVSEYFTRKHQTALIDKYQEALNGLSEEEIQKQFELATDYNNSIRGNPVKDPFLEGSGIAIPKNYNQILNYDNLIGYVEIPKLSIKIPVCHGVDEKTLRYYVGHIPETAFPIGGEGNHAVLCGHRGLTTAKLFTDLDKVEKGDVFYIHVLDQTPYKVDQINIVLPEDTTLLKYEPGKDLVTLLTCHPYSINSHRLLVRGTRIPYEEAKAQEAAAKKTFDFIDWFSENRLMISIIFLSVIFTAILVIIFLRRKRNRPEHLK